MRKRNLLEEKVLDFIKKHVNENGFTDITSTEIGRRLAYTECSIAAAVKGLEQQGEIRREHLKGMPGKVKRIFLVRRDSE